MLYVDFSKAFDSVSHKLLLHKLEYYGLSGSFLESYLSNKYQRVVLDGCISKWLPVVSGVPHGSILAPLTFLLYINDIPNVIKIVISLFKWMTLKYTPAYQLLLTV